MFCSNCRNELKDGEMFCGNCGAKVGPTIASQPQVQTTYPIEQNTACKSGKMKTWKLVSGIISICLFPLISFQSCAVGFVNAWEANNESSGSSGIICAILILAGGIVSIATRGSSGNGGNKALIALFGIAALVGVTGGGSYFGDLVIWGIWAAVNAGLAFKAMHANK